MEKRPDDFHSPKPRKAAGKTVVETVLAATVGAGMSLLSLLSGLLAAALILYSGYVLYDAQCKQKMQRIGPAAGTSYSVKKLKKGTYYKYMAVAIDANQKVLACSRTVHEATAGGKVGNPKKVTTRKSKLTLKKGKSAKLGGKIIKPSGKKVRTHRKLLYESSNEAVATVTKAGKVKAVGKGNCVIYVYAQNGLFKKVKVKVK